MIKSALRECTNGAFLRRSLEQTKEMIYTSLMLFKQRRTLKMLHLLYALVNVALVNNSALLFMGAFFRNHLLQPIYANISRCLTWNKNRRQKIHNFSPEQRIKASHHNNYRGSRPVQSQNLFSAPAILDVLLLRPEHISKSILQGDPKKRENCMLIKYGIERAACNELYHARV